MRVAAGANMIVGVLMIGVLLLFVVSLVSPERRHAFWS